jgi:hypothetical protein
MPRISTVHTSQKKAVSPILLKLTTLSCKPIYFSVLVERDFAYFFLNFSTLPSASTIFCFPVKKGWHFEQMSTRIVGFVDLVVKDSPHAHTTVDSL